MSPSLIRPLFLHGGIYTASRVVHQAMGFILIPLYAHLIGDDGYGIVSVMSTICAFLGFIFLQGLHGAWYRLRFDKSGPKELRVFETTIIWYLLLTSVLGLGLLSILGRTLAHFVTPGIPFYPLGMLAAFTAAAWTFATLYERKLQAEQRPLAFAVFSGCRTILTLGTIILFVAGLRRGAQGKIEADALTAGLLAVVALFLLRPGSFRLFSKDDLHSCLSYGAPLVPHGLAGLVNSLFDRIILNMLLGLGATGVYAMGYQFAGIGLVLATALNQAFAPLYIRTMKEVDEAHAMDDEQAAAVGLRSIARAAMLMVTTVACLVLCLTACARELLMILTTAAFRDAWTVVAPVAAAIVTWAAYYTFAQSITYDRRRVRLLPVITAFTACVNIGGNFVLIPRMGILGAAWATLLSSACMALLALWVGQRTTPVPYDWPKWGLLFVWCSIGLTGLWVFDARIDDTLMRCAFKAAWTTLCTWMVLRTTRVSWTAFRQLWPPRRGNV